MNSTLSTSFNDNTEDKHFTTFIFQVFFVNIAVSLAESNSNIEGETFHSG